MASCSLVSPIFSLRHLLILSDSRQLRVEALERQDRVDGSVPNLLHQLLEAVHVYPKIFKAKGRVAVVLKLPLQKEGCVVRHERRQGVEETCWEG